KKGNDPNYPIQVINATFEWEKGQRTWHNQQELANIDTGTRISNVNLSVKAGDLVFIIGKVGSGKSSLINGILGEMKRVSGEVYITGSIAYCPQEPWIQNATIRDNITFGKPYEKEKYNHVVQICALQTDLNIMEFGDLTEIGEKGIADWFVSNIVRC